MSAAAGVSTDAALPSSSSVTSTANNTSLSPGSEDIRKALECPVCVNVCIPPIFQCRNGHTVCNECYAKVKSCASCRTPLGKGKIRCLALEQLAKGAEFSCRNSDQGCLKKMKLDDMKLHGFDCEFGSANFCNSIRGLKSCTLVVKTAELCQHLLDHHEAKLVDFDSLVLQQTTRLWAPSGPFPPICASFNGTLFILQTEVELGKSGIIWSVLCVGSSKNANKFTAQFTIHDYDSFSQKYAPKMSWQGRVLGLDSDSSFDCRTHFLVSFKQMDFYSKKSSVNDELPYSSWKLSFKILDVSDDSADHGGNARVASEIVEHARFDTVPPPLQEAAFPAEVGDVDGEGHSDSYSDIDDEDMDDDYEVDDYLGDDYGDDDYQDEVPQAGTAAGFFQNLYNSLVAPDQADSDVSDSDY